jgi:hypothetical protein
MVSKPGGHVMRQSQHRVKRDRRRNVVWLISYAGLALFFIGRLTVFIVEEHSRPTPVTVLVLTVVGTLLGGFALGWSTTILPILLRNRSLRRRVDASQLIDVMLRPEFCGNSKTPGLARVEQLAFATIEVSNSHLSVWTGVREPVEVATIRWESIIDVVTGTFTYGFRDWPLISITAETGTLKFAPLAATRALPLTMNARRQADLAKALVRLMPNGPTS